jgi:hypothetical protein
LVDCAFLGQTAAIYDQGTTLPLSIFDVEFEVNSKRTDASKRKPSGLGYVHTRERQRGDLGATLVHCPWRERKVAWVGVARLILLVGV